MAGVTGYKKSIYKPKERFINIANDMLFAKRLEVDPGNKVLIIKEGDETIQTTSQLQLNRNRRDLLTGRISRADEIRISDLSSGEKQLLIFLAETVLRSNTPYIFIADEPELSLHIEWQERLVPVILELNPDAQILFATHSPDIVNKFRNNVFSMEGITK
jgi:predicted ATPase